MKRKEIVSSIRVIINSLEAISNSIETNDGTQPYDIVCLLGGNKYIIENILSKIGPKSAGDKLASDD